MTSVIEAPDTERARLAALTRLDLLDTEPEPEFDELVQLAAAICEAPVSLVTLLDEDRQWFKAAIGIEMRETPRNIAFCAHAIQQPEMLIIEDAELDSRFAQNPLVTGDANVRFYAGMPIYSPDGFAMGTLCVLDRKPRRLLQSQLDALRIIALQVNARMELRVQRRQLQTALAAAELSNAELSSAQAHLQAAHKRLLEISVTDDLTGLSNRRAFDERLAAEMTASNRGANLSLLLLDIDHFKRRNDRYGHEAGDDVLRRIGSILRKAVRGTDVAARYGGEEFALLLRDASGPGALALANRLLHAVRNEVWPEEPMTVSIGIAERLQGEPEGKVLLARADLALYRAKAEGRDRIVMYGQLT